MEWNKFGMKKKRPQTPVKILTALEQTVIQQKDDCEDSTPASISPESSYYDNRLITQGYLLAETGKAMAIDQWTKLNRPA